MIKKEVKLMEFLNRIKELDTIAKSHFDGIRVKIEYYESHNAIIKISDKLTIYDSDRIKNACTRAHKEIVDDIKDSDFTRHDVLIWQLIYLYLNQELKISKKRIAIIFGKDRSTVIYAIRRLEFSVRAKLHRHDMIYNFYVKKLLNKYIINN